MVAFSRQGDIWVRPAAGGEARRIIERDLAGGNGGFVWSPDGTRMAFTRGASGFSQLGVVDVRSGIVTPITNAPLDHESPSWSPDGRELVFVRSDDVGMSQDVVVVDATGSGKTRVITEGRPKGLRSGPKFSPDGASIAFTESTGVSTRDLWIFPAQGGAARQVTNSMGRIDPTALPVPEEVFFPSVDSMSIPAILWKPNNLDPTEKYPVIVQLHGHPGQWNHGFQRETQYFVDRGFVVIAPNPRGSTGFGAGFHDLHIGDYGGMELDDVMSVLPYLESLGYVDMTRKATWGGSGGGYMSFVIATERPDQYQAQVIRAPVADWELLAVDRFGAAGMAWTAGRTPVRERSEFGGAPDEIPDEYFNRSPINFVENVQVPQLLMQGLRDSSVQPRQSRVWAKRMRELGKGDLLTYVE
jgi:dipeptidyl aminopeptidase/acylaminoacyl peptidase